MYNRLKMANAGAEIHEKMLQEQTKSFGLAVDGITNRESELEELRDNKDLIDTTEVQLNDAGREKTSETITQDQLDKGKSKLTTLRDDTWEHSPVQPLAVLNQAYEQEHLKAFKAADTAPDDTAFWDKYVGEQLLGESTKQVGKMGPSQLANSPDRFKSISTDPYEICPTKFKKMVMASLETNDAVLFDLFVKTAGRNMTSEESALLEKVSADKAKLLLACEECSEDGGGYGGTGGADDLAEPLDPRSYAERHDRWTREQNRVNHDDVQSLHRFVSDPNTPHDERWEAALEKLTRLRKQASTDESRYEKNPKTGKLGVKPAVWDKEWAKCPKCNGKKGDCAQCYGRGFIRRHHK